MNEEFLLQAVGHIDEDLIVQAEEYRPAKRPSLRRPLAGLAACLAVVFGLYWGMNNLGMGSGASNGSASASGGGASSETTTSPNEGQTGDGSPNTVDEVLLVIVPVGDNRYAYFHYYGEDRVLDTLPEGCRSLGEVGQYTEGEDIPYTDRDVFPGCPLWIAGEGWDGPVYLQTPEGTYLECIKG